MTRFAMEDAYPNEREEALKMVETCSECAVLAADVRLIAAAVPRLPVATRTRDFTITAEQADRLKGSGLSRWLRTLAMPGWAALRPVAGVALSIGLVMAVVGAGIPGSVPMAEFRDDPTNQGAAPADPGAAETMQPDRAGANPPPELGPVLESARETLDPATEQLDTAYVAEPSPEADSDGERTQLRQYTPADPTRDLLVYAGLIIATLSFALLALAWVARRYFADPLLR